MLNCCLLEDGRFRDAHRRFTNVASDYNPMFTLTNTASCGNVGFLTLWPAAFQELSVPNVASLVALRLLASVFLRFVFCVPFPLCEFVLWRRRDDRHCDAPR